MKKVFALMMVCAFAVAMVACGGSNQAADEAKRKADSTRVADSLAAAAAAAAAAAVDTTAADSTAKP